MKNIFYTVSIFGLLLFVTPTAYLHAQQGGIQADIFGNFLKTVSQIISDATIFFYFLAFFLFVWGLVKYLILSGGDEEARAKGKSIMIWGVVAFFLITSIWGIAYLIQNLTGLDQNANVDLTFPGPVT